ncbi:MAG: thiolase domain-containing protein, partial [FCB group bacterium]|nr:thiolase domain-containing protein [FCB group bacterium]
VGLHKWGELWEKSLRDIFVEAALNALDDAGLDRLDSMYVGNMSAGLFVGQEHIGALMSDYLGVNPIPATRVESACASGGAAVRQAFIEVASGMSDIVLAGGVEKMLDVDGSVATAALATAADQEYEVYNGATFPGLYAMMARLHMHKYGTTSEQLAAVAVKNHFNGSMNPNAQFPTKITVDQVLNSILVCDPLHILDCSPITDGAAAVIMCPLEMAKKFTDKPIVKISGIGQASDTIALHHRPDPAWLKSVEIASENAFKMAGKKHEDIDLVEVHDCFTIAEIMAIEAMGFVEKGKGGQAAESGMTALDGKLPVNTSGGLKSKGHPVGATGVAQVIEIAHQLRGESGERQIKDARTGMAQNMGGTGASAVCTIMEVV